MNSIEFSNEVVWLHQETEESAKHTMFSTVSECVNYLNEQRINVPLENCYPSGQEPPHILKLAYMKAKARWHKLVFAEPTEANTMALSSTYQDCISLARRIYAIGGTLN